MSLYINTFVNLQSWTFNRAIFNVRTCSTSCAFLHACIIFSFRTATSSTSSSYEHYTLNGNQYNYTATLTKSEPAFAIQGLRPSPVLYPGQVCSRCSPLFLIFFFFVFDRFVYFCVATSRLMQVVTFIDLEVAIAPVGILFLIYSHNLLNHHYRSKWHSFYLYWHAHLYAPSNFFAS